jgi:hypothetical protein
MGVGVLLPALYEEGTITSGSGTPHACRMRGRRRAPLHVQFRRHRCFSQGRIRRQVRRASGPSRRARIGVCGRGCDGTERDECGHDVVSQMNASVPSTSCSSEVLLRPPKRQYVLRCAPWSVWAQITSDKDQLKHKRYNMQIVSELRGGLDGTIVRSPGGRNGAPWGSTTLPTSPSPERRPIRIPVVGTHARRATI